MNFYQFTFEQIQHIRRNKKYSFGEVVDCMGRVNFKISDLVFNHDPGPEFIISYFYSGRFYYRNLNEYIDDDN